MSIVISHKTLSLKTKGKTKANIAPLNEGDVEDFSAKVDTAVSAEPHIDKQAKNISKPQTLKNPNQKDNQDVAQEPKDQIQSASTKLTQHNNVQTADILAKQIVSQNGVKQDLGIKKEVKSFKDSASGEQSLTTLLEKASENKNIGLQSAQIEIHSAPAKAKASQIDDSPSRKNTPTKEIDDSPSRKNTPTKESAQKTIDAKEINDATTESSSGELKVTKDTKRTLSDLLKLTDLKPKDEKKTVDTNLSKQPIDKKELLKSTSEDLTKQDGVKNLTNEQKVQIAPKDKKQDKEDIKKTDLKRATQEAQTSEQPNNEDAAPSVSAVTTATIKPIAKEKKQDDEQDKPKQNTDAQANALMQTTQKKTDDFTAKMAQTTQTLKYFSDDIKEQIDSYRPPLMKLSLNLNPQDLGAINVTMTARGGALNVSMTSNQSALQMLMQNSGQLQQNLTALGFTNLAINFNVNDKKTSDKKSDEKDDEKQEDKNADETKVSFIDSIDLKIFDSKYT